MTDLIRYNIQGAGKTLLLMHGWAMHAAVWADFAAALSLHYKVITVDLRGHGASGSMPGPYTFDVFADDMVRLIDHLRLSSITAIGWSMGVSILMKMCERSVPALDSLVFISGNPSLVCRADYGHGIPKVTVQRLYKQISRQYPGGLRNFHDLLFTPQELNALLGSPLYGALTDTDCAPAQQAALESLQCLQDEDLRRVLPHITVPTLLVHGLNDRICLYGAAEYMAEKIKDSQTFLLNDTGHIPFISQKQRVYDAIQSFLKQM